MADEPNTIADTPAPELETPAIEAPQDGAPISESENVDLEALSEQEAETEESEQPDQPTVEVDPDLEDLEIDGKTFKAPKGVKDRLMMHEDYTRKTQALAAKARDYDVARQLTEAEIGARTQVAQIDAALKQWETVDWQTYEQTDPLAAQSAWRQYQQLKDSRSTALTQLSQAAQTRTQLAQQDFAKRREETAKFAAKAIPGWTPKLGDEIYEFAKQSGLTEHGIRNNLSPEFLRFAYRAYRGYQLEQKAAAPKPKPAPQLQPLQTVAGRASPTSRSDLASLDMDAYVAARRKGVGGKALR